MSFRLSLSPLAQSSPSQRPLNPSLSLPLLVQKHILLVAHSPLLASAIGRSLISLQISDPQLLPPGTRFFQLPFPKACFPVSNMQQASLKWWLRPWDRSRVNAVPRH